MAYYFATGFYGLPDAGTAMISNSLTGVGLDIKHKIYLKPDSMKPQGFYAQYGIMFQYFSITRTGNILNPIPKTGLNIMKLLKAN